MTVEHTKAFNVEYVQKQQWEHIRRLLDRDFPEGRFDFLDVGGGNGLFADRLLEQYPGSRGVVLDISEYLLGQNQPHPRKILVHDTVANVAARMRGKQFDLVCLNWVLHHFVGDTYSGSKQNMVAVLKAIAPLLSAQGRISVFENLYNGIVMDDFPSVLVYHLTGSKWLAPLVKRMGANTAGTGVCFLSKKRWLEKFAKAGLEVLSAHEDEQWAVPWALKAVLNVHHLSYGHFWCRVPSEDAWNQSLN